MNPTTGEAWYIRHQSLSGDEISYCRPSAKGPVQCQVAEILDAPPG